MLLGAGACVASRFQKLLVSDGSSTEDSRQLSPNLSLCPGGNVQVLEPRP